MSSLEDQLAEAFKSGFQAGERASLDDGEALSSSLADDKYTKAEANFRQADDDQECGGCQHFNDGHCELVSGLIRATNVCDYYEELDDGK